MVAQIFRSPQVKRSVIINNKLAPRVAKRLQTEQNFRKTSTNFTELRPSAQSSSQNENFSVLVKIS